jgi:hypothetical protein
MEYIDALNRVNSFYNARVMEVINNISIEGVRYQELFLEEIDIRAILANMLYPRLFYRDLRYEDYPNVDEIIIGVIIDQLNRVDINQAQEDILAVNNERNIAINQIHAAEDENAVTRVMHHLAIDVINMPNNTQVITHQEAGDNSALMGDVGIIFLCGNDGLAQI